MKYDDQAIIDAYELAIAAQANDDQQQVQRLLKYIDRLQDHDEEQLNQPGALLTAALFYAANNLRVLPLKPGEKIPTQGSHGVDDATTDRATVLKWWRQNPAYNIGLAAGDGFMVIDLDGPQAFAAYNKMLDMMDPLTHYTDCNKKTNCQCVIDAANLAVKTGKDPYGDLTLARARTPRGMHLYVLNAKIDGKPINNKIGLMNQFDIKTTGGYVVAPPSKLNNGGTYRWSQPPHRLIRRLAMTKANNE